MFGHTRNHTLAQGGFTLLEISIALVILGLLIAGIFAGREMIKSAEIRGAVAQIDEIETAVRVFKFKYNVLPGDGRLSQFGIFNTRSGGSYLGDGNGIISHYPVPGTWSSYSCGEVLLFWSDLAAAGYLSNGGSAGIGLTASLCPTHVLYPDVDMASYIPRSMFSGNFISIVSAGSGQPTRPNAYYISGMTRIDADGRVWPISTIPPMSAYMVDVKIDDGVATTGNVFSVMWQSWYWTINYSSASGCFTGTAYNVTNTSATAMCALGINSKF